MTDLQAAIGVEQLKKLPDFIEKRRYNWQKLRRALECVEDVLLLPQAAENSNPSWFGFLISVKPASGRTRDEILDYLETHGIQTRLLFAGNLTKQPCLAGSPQEGIYRIAGGLAVSDYIMENSFWVGVYPGMSDAEIDYVAQTLTDAVRN